MAAHLQVQAARWLTHPDAAQIPALLHAWSGTHLGQWGVLRDQNAQGQWVSEWWDAPASAWRERADDELPDHLVATFRVSRPYTVSASPVFALIREEILAHRKILREVVLGGVMINVVALAISFYSRQVYDRVSPTGASQTLLVLTLGVLLALIFDRAAKRVCSSLFERLIDRVDPRLARAVYLRFLSVRLDQLPPSVGGLAAQLRATKRCGDFLPASPPTCWWMRPSRCCSCSSLG